MIDKSLVKRRFEKSLKTYDENAVIQKIMAKNLTAYLNNESYDFILEIGCSTGILTAETVKHIKFKRYFANDIVEKSQEYFKRIIPQGVFLSGDIENIDITGKFDLIISNACLQWCNDIERTIDKLYCALNKGGILAVSMFGNNNLKEIKALFDISDDSYQIENMRLFLSKYNLKIFKEEDKEILFCTPLDVLKHLKYTGANALKNYSFTKTKLKNFENDYEKLFKKENKVSLTYNPVYIVLKKFYDI